jgi:hypothetical protein
MDTLNIQIDKYSFKHKYASLRWRMGWKLQNSKWPWGTIYRYFWRKRLEKRILEVSKMISERAIYGVNGFDPSLPFPPVISKPDYELSVPAKDVPVIPLAPPLPIIPPILSAPPLNPSLYIAPAGVAVMDPTHLYSVGVLPTALDFEVVIRKPHIRVYHHRKRQPTKSRVKPR